MGDDPLKLGLLDTQVIDEAVAQRPSKKKEEAALMRAEVNKQKEERLAGKGAARAAPPAPPPPEPPPVVDKSKLLDQLGAYKERFPDLKSRNKVSGKSSLDEIEDEIHYVQMQLGTKERNMGTHVFLACMVGVEEVTAKHWNPMGLNLTGLGKVAQTNADEFAPIIDELVIKYGASFYVSPEMRLALAVGTMMYTVHAANSGDARTAAALAKMSAAMPASAPTDL